jgi:hypothetical protein
MGMTGLRDWVIMGLVLAAWINSTIFLWHHPTDTNFATWAGLLLTVTGVYHWICYKDQKVPDNP